MITSNFRGIDYFNISIEYANKKVLEVTKLATSLNAIIKEIQSTVHTVMLSAPGTHRYMEKAQITQT